METDGPLETARTDGGNEGIDWPLALIGAAFGGLFAQAVAPEYTVAGAIIGAGLALKYLPAE